MSDHEFESKTDRDTDSTTSSFSTNGKAPGITAEPPAGTDVGDVDDGGSFLAELARAMQSTATAEQARNVEVTEQRRQTHVDAIRAREAIEAEELRELAKQDVQGIDAWSDGEIKRIKLERERRIAARREQLQTRLEEHRTVVASEVQAVEAAIAAYRADIEQYFTRLGSGTDPVSIAQEAGTRPAFPVLELIGPDDLPAAAPGDSEAPLVEGTPTPAGRSAGEGDGGDAGGGTAPPAEGQSDVAESGGGTADTTDPSDASPAPVAAVAEARVAVPRASGAGSWLRWPNSSADRSDSGH